MATVRVPNKLFNNIEQAGVYLSNSHPQFAKQYFICFLKRSGLAEISWSSFLHVTTKMTQLKTDQLYDDCVREAWRDFLETHKISEFTQIKNKSELEEINTFFLKIFTHPKEYPLKLIEDIMKIFERYFASNKGQTQVIARIDFRNLLFRLALGRAQLILFEKFKEHREQISQILTLVEKKLVGENIDHKNNLFQEKDFPQSASHFLSKLFSLLYDVRPSNNLLYMFTYSLSKMLDNLQDYNTAVAIQIFLQFHQLIEQQNSILYERLDIAKISLPKTIDAFLHKCKELKDLVEVAKYFIQRIKEIQIVVTYKDVLKKLQTGDLYNLENESMLLQYFVYEQRNYNQRQRQSEYVDDAFKQLFKDYPQFQQQHHELTKINGYIRYQCCPEKEYVEYDFTNKKVYHSFKTRDFQVQIRGQIRKCNTIKEVIDILQNQ